MISVTSDFTADVLACPMISTKLKHAVMKIGVAVIVACLNFLLSTFYRPPNADESFLVNFKEFLAK